jgi:hypothetical protein
VFVSMNEVKEAIEAEKRLLNNQRK